VTQNEQIARYGNLSPGSLIKLARPLGEKIDINVAGVRFGSGELVRVGGVLSIRMTGFHSGKAE
jgi:flagellar motor switch/type III secretory pathway protein FliN